MPKWLTIALSEWDFNVKEIPGPEDNPRIVEYHASTTLKATNDETPWCSAFVNWCITQAGLIGTNSARARLWLNWGNALKEPRRGCIVVLQRNNNPAMGHVGFYIGEDHSHVVLLGGNQADKVCMRPFSKSSVLGYRWPEDVE